jgi:hypothetical protein
MKCSPISSPVSRLRRQPGWYHPRCTQLALPTHRIVLYRSECVGGDASQHWAHRIAANLVMRSTRSGRVTVLATLIAGRLREFLRLLVPIGRPAFPIPAGINDWRLKSLNLHQGIPRSGSAKQKCVISEVNSTELGIVASDQNTPLDGLGLEQQGQGCFTDAMDAVRSLELSVTAADGCRSKTRSTGSSGLLRR